MTESMQIIHEEPELVVIVKASGFLSVPGRGPDKQDSVAKRVADKYTNCIAQPAVHRLDMDTSGLLVLARTAEAHRNLSIQFQDRVTDKLYIAILEGVIHGNGGTIELPFRLDVDNRPRQIYDETHGKMGITHWRKIADDSNGFTRVEFKPITGRTHQLRVHSAHELGLGIPIVGDPLYGSGTGPGAMKLHAAELSFDHPTSGERLTFQSQPDW